MEKLIVIAVIIVGSIVHSWIQRKQEEAAGEGTPTEPRPPRPPRRAPPARTGAPTAPAPQGGGTNWEEELRRLLQGEVPGTSSAPPAPPPLPGPTGSSRPVSKAAPAAPPPVLARTNIPIPDEGMEMEVGLPVRPVSFHQASSAHDRAQIQSAVAQRMHDTATRVTAHSGLASQRQRSARAAGVRRLLRDRESQRDVILASIILGPPRSLESAR